MTGSLSSFACYRRSRWLRQSMKVLDCVPGNARDVSVALEILRRLVARDFLTASVDLFYVASNEELAATIFKAVIETEPGPRRLAVYSLNALARVGA